MEDEEVVTLCLGTTMEGLEVVEDEQTMMRIRR